MERGSDEEYKNLSKELKSAIRRHKRKQATDEIDEAVDDKGRWKGIKFMKRDYQPTPYALKDNNGKLVPPSQQADTIATYLEQDHWGKREGPENQWRGPGE